MKFCVFVLLIAGLCVADELRSNKSSKQLCEEAVRKFFRRVLENWKNIIESGPGYGNKEIQAYLNDLCSKKDSMKTADRLVQLFLNNNKDNKAQVFVNTILASLIRLLADSVIEKADARWLKTSSRNIFENSPIFIIDGSTIKIRPSDRNQKNKDGRFNYVTLPIDPLKKFLSGGLASFCAFYNTPALQNFGNASDSQFNTLLGDLFNGMGSFICDILGTGSVAQLPGSGTLNNFFLQRLFLSIREV
ncbi:uncharacterized protein LOC116337218 [Contarinia nasturtii]|uniref:uncharacterized protein LOC116337218 n=1 Tax=Contarinia nasturtii TaxID=265458 RepID=UPI0012D38DAA|nr:uncharacterized protein LOC116337218 [Contarinia nasturtii]